MRGRTIHCRRERHTIGQSIIFFFRLFTNPKSVNLLFCLHLPGNSGLMKQKKIQQTEKFAYHRVSKGNAVQYSNSVQFNERERKREEEKKKLSFWNE